MLLTNGWVGQYFGLSARQRISFSHSSLSLPSHKMLNWRMFCPKTNIPDREGSRALIQHRNVIITSTKGATLRLQSVSETIDWAHVTATGIVDIELLATPDAGAGNVTNDKSLIVVVNECLAISFDSCGGFVFGIDTTKVLPSVCETSDMYEQATHGLIFMNLQHISK